jgi:quinol monooxygenase YgiN
MHISRRDFMATAAGAALVIAVPAHASLMGTPMYGLIGKMKVVPGQRDALISILLEGLTGMPGCLSYIVAQDPTDPDAIWITEAWDSKASHQASLALPSVKLAISRGRPLIAGFGERFETTPVGGQGLGARAAAA